MPDGERGTFEPSCCYPYRHLTRSRLQDPERRRQLFNTGEPRTSRREACASFATGNLDDYRWSSRTPIVTESVPPAHRGR